MHQLLFKKNLSEIYTPLFFTLIVILHHFIGYIGHYGYDDLHYAQLAQQLIHGIFNPEDHYSYRICLIGMTSLSYLLWGVNDLASAIPSMVASIAGIMLISKILQNEPIWIRFIALSLFSLNFWNLHYSDKLMPDNLLAFFCFAAIYFLFKYRSNADKNFLMCALGTAFSIFIAFNTKGTIVLLLPLFLYYFVLDLYQHKPKRFWYLTGSLLVVMLAGYFLFWEMKYGNAQIRFKAITQNSYLNFCSYAEQPLLFTMKRIGYGFLLMLNNTYLMTALAFILADWKNTFSRTSFNADTPKTFFSTSAVLLMLSSNFMSISLISYSPMCLDPRHFLFLVPVSSIAAAYIIKDHFRDKNFYFRLIAIWIALGVASLIAKAETSHLLYLPLVITSIGCFLMRDSRFFKIIFSILLFTVLLFGPLKMILYGRTIQFQKQEQIVKQEVLSIQEPCVVVTDDVQCRLGRYMQSFSDTCRQTFFSYSEFEGVKDNEKRPVYILRNWYTSYLSNIQEQKLPMYAKIPQMHSVIFDDPELQISLLKLKKQVTPAIIIESVNLFEEETAHWSKGANEATVIYSGNFSSKVDMYSSTFSIGLNELQLNNTTQLFITASLQINLEEEPAPLVVISVEKNNTSEYWKGIPLASYIKAYGNWSHIELNQPVDLSVLSPDATLKIFVYNKDRAKLYIDNFSIQICSINTPEGTSM